MAERGPSAGGTARRLRGRNLALAAVLAALVILFYVMTIVRMGGAAS